MLGLEPQFLTETKLSHDILYILHICLWTFAGSIYSWNAGYNWFVSIHDFLSRTSQFHHPIRDILLACKVDGEIRDCIVLVPSKKEYILDVFPLKLAARGIYLEPLFGSADQDRPSISPCGTTDLFSSFTYYSEHFLTYHEALLRMIRIIYSKSSSLFNFHYRLCYHFGSKITATGCVFMRNKK